MEHEPSEVFPIDNVELDFHWCVRFWDYITFLIASTLESTLFHVNILWNKVTEDPLKLPYKSNGDSTGTPKIFQPTSPSTQTPSPDTWRRSQMAKRSTGTCTPTFIDDPNTWDVAINFYLLPKIHGLFSGWCSTLTLLRPFARHLVGKMTIHCSFAHH